MRSIALDASSTHIGWALMDGNQLRFSGTRKLKGALIERIGEAYDFLLYLLDQTWAGTKVLYVEAPAGNFKKGLIPQCFVGGAIRLACYQHGVEVVEVAPTSAKLALAKDGRADKIAMMKAAAPYLGYDEQTLAFVAPKSGSAYAMQDNAKVFDEHTADAVGVAFAGVVNH